MDAPRQKKLASDNASSQELGSGHSLVENARIARCRKWTVAQFRGSASSASDDSARGLWCSWQAGV